MLTTEEVNEKYSGVKLTFSSYYKYAFDFEGKAEDGAEIMATFGGDPDEIYKFSVGADNEELFECVDVWSFVNIKKDGETIYTGGRY